MNTWSEGFSATNISGAITDVYGSTAANTKSTYSAAPTPEHYLESLKGITVLAPEVLQEVDYLETSQPQPMAPALMIGSQR